MQQGQVIGNNIFHLIGNKNLIAVQLNFIALQLNIVFDFREIQNTCKIERIINIQMDMEQRVFRKGI